MAQVLDLIKESLQQLEVLDPRETPDASMVASALASLNDILDAWSVETLLVYTNSIGTFNLVAGTAQYTIGPTGTFSAERPVFIDTGYVTFASTESQIEVVPQGQYASLNVKTEQGIPQWMVYNTTFPNGTITVWPVPYTNGTITLYRDALFAPFASSLDTITFPPGYRRALKFALACEEAGKYGINNAATMADGSSLAQKAASTKANIKRANRKNRRVVFESSMLGFNGYGQV